MEDDENFSKNILEKCSYRYLQQLAKSLCLPSNVKKIYLIQLIVAKKFSTPAEVDNIVQKVKLERQQLAQIKKKGSRRKLHLQGTEISSTSNSQSPPIMVTPKRPGHIVLGCNSDLRHAVMKYNTYTHTKAQSPKRNGSDRVLRSFNLKAIKKPNQSLVNMNAMIGVIKAQNSANSKETCINIVSQNGKFPKFNLTAKCIVKKEKPMLTKTVMNLKNRNQGQLMPIPTNVRPHLHPVRRIHRTLSGIYPINHKDTPKTYEYIQSIGFRHQDGKMSKINALVQKPNQKTCEDYRNITVQDLINSNIDAQTFANTNIREYIHTDAIQNSMYPNMTGLTENNESDTVSIENSELIKENEDVFSMYYHKKIRGEQVRYQRSIDKDRDDMLPRITDVFSKFNDYGKDVTQPLYVQVSEESVRTPNCPLFLGKSQNDMMLESLYNFKNMYLTNQPLLQIATTTNTRCVYSTPVIATAMAQQSTTVASEHCNMASCEQDSQYQCDIDAIPRIYDFLKLTEQEVSLRSDYDKCGDLSASDSSLETSQSQDLGASVTIPEMVEDALEIISQDGDYLERIGMDIRMQCILCSWAGPKIILDHHIRKEHSTEIHKHNNNEWNITYTLGSLVEQRLWHSQVIEHQATLYILSAKCEDDCFSATISTLSPETDTPKTGNITIYNRVTGEPYTWEGEIQHLPPNLPYDNESNCLKLELSKMNLLPNSANLKLLNGELVIKSPSKVVVGQPVLNDIHIILFVKIFD